METGSSVGRSQSKTDRPTDRPSSSPLGQFDHERTPRQIQQPARQAGLQGSAGRGLGQARRSIASSLVAACRSHRSLSDRSAVRLAQASLDSQFMPRQNANDGRPNRSTFDQGAQPRRTPTLLCCHPFFQRHVAHTTPHVALVSFEKHNQKRGFFGAMLRRP